MLCARAALAALVLGRRARRTIWAGSLLQAPLPPSSQFSATLPSACAVQQALSTRVGCHHKAAGSCRTLRLLGPDVVDMLNVTRPVATTAAHCCPPLLLRLHRDLNWAIDGARQAISRALNECMDGPGGAWLSCP